MIVMVLPQKDRYTLEELFNNLPVSFRKLGELSGVNKVTIDYIRFKRRKPYRSTMNRLLAGFSKVYDREFTWDNVTGIDIERDNMGQVQEGSEHE